MQKNSFILVAAPGTFLHGVGNLLSPMTWRASVSHCQGANTHMRLTLCSHPPKSTCCSFAERPVHLMASLLLPKQLKHTFFDNCNSQIHSNSLL